MKMIATRLLPPMTKSTKSMISSLETIQRRIGRHEKRSRLVEGHNTQSHSSVYE